MLGGGTGTGRVRGMRGTVSTHEQEANFETMMTEITTMVIIMVLMWQLSIASQCSLQGCWSLTATPLLELAHMLSQLRRYQDHDP